jgi:hypothetical protein
MRSLLLSAVLVVWTAALQTTVIDTASIKGAIWESGTTSGIPGVRVQIGSASTLTDPGGSFLIEGLPPGEHSVTVIRDGFLPAGRTGESSLPVPSVRMGPGHIVGSMRIRAGQQISDVHVELVREAVITGKVSLPTGEGAPGAAISLYQVIYRDGTRRLAHFLRTGMGQANDRGEYRLWGLPPGEYYLIASQRSVGNPELKAFYPAAETTAEARPIRARPGSTTVADVQLRQPRVDRLPIRIGFPSGENIVPRMVVMVVPQGADPSLQLMTMLLAPDPPRGRDTGRPVSVPIPSGRSNLFIAARGSNAYHFGEFGVTSSSNPAVTVLPLSATIDLTGRIVVEPSASSLDSSLVKISLRPLDTLRYYAWVDREFFRTPLANEMAPDGTFTIRGVAAGEYSVEIQLPPGVHLADVRHGDRSVLESNLTVQLEKREPLEIVLGGAVDGVLRNAAGQTLAFRQVVLVPDVPRRRSFDLYRTVYTDHQGRFEFLDLTPGSYRAFAWAEIPDSAWTDESYLRPFENRGHAVRSSEGQRTRNLAVRLISEDQPTK